MPGVAALSSRAMLHTRTSATLSTSPAPLLAAPSVRLVALSASASPARTPPALLTAAPSSHTDTSPASLDQLTARWCQAPSSNPTPLTCVAVPSTVTVTVPAPPSSTDTRMRSPPIESSVRALVASDTTHSSTVICFSSDGHPTPSSDAISCPRVRSSAGVPCVGPRTAAALPCALVIGVEARLMAPPTTSEGRTAARVARGFLKSIHSDVSESEGTVKVQSHRPHPGVLAPTGPAPSATLADVPHHFCPGPPAAVQAW
mmetsp:Transcript_7429/g.17474  ORF Transcript_7429/g.17474 Transcript_7429/m.17474 type:complete len:259 (-) Transcript_7429:2447-3223(-)